jgi:hypothetical protein
LDSRAPTRSSSYWRVFLTSNTTGLFYDWAIDTATAVVTNFSASIRPLYAAVRNTLGPA